MVITGDAGVKRKAQEIGGEEPVSKRVRTSTIIETSTHQQPSSDSGAGPTENEHDSATLEQSEESEKKKGKRRAAAVDGEAGNAQPKPKTTYRKLAPPRPFPTVPTSVSATGPRSAHVEGKNYICITRKTPLGAYLRRCKDVILKDGHKTLHLNAMGAAIPHLIQLATSLPGILPYAPEEIQTEVLTGTVEVQDEVIPEDEDEDISYRSRGKSTISVVIKIGDGVDEGARTGKGRKNWRNGVAPASGGDSRNKRQGRKQNQAPKDKPRGSEEKRTAEPERIVIREEDMENE